MKNADMPAMSLYTGTESGTCNGQTYTKHFIDGEGLTKREMFAMHAMQGLLAANSGWENSSPMTNSEIAQEAVDLADDLLEVLEK